MSGPVLPGRLGSADMTLATDPRADPRMLAVLNEIGLGDPIPSPVDASSPLEELHAFVSMAEQGYEELFGALASSAPAVDGVTRSVVIIRGSDGNDITLFVHRPATGSGPMPGILHLHGGGMVLLEAAGAAYAGWRDRLAGEGLIVVGVEFRNAGGKHGPHPFPAGLNDCASALAWMHANRDQLGLSKIVVSGESGGGNLTLATTLKAKRDGRIDHIDGAYAMCPYISGTYANPPMELASLHENDGYFLDCKNMGALAKVYDPDGAHALDPLAWPWHASTADLTGLPPHVISVNQLDPLRDEGLAYFRALLDAGVSATSRTVNGTCHAGDLIFTTAMPDVTGATVRDIASFARSL
jgi:acetyl esterase